MNDRPVEIVLTGGPASGKTSSLAILSQKLSDWGFRVLVAPEVATLLISGGIFDISRIAADPAWLQELESHFLAFQRSLRQRYLALAQSFVERGERVVIIYDRGESDVAAYIGDGAWAQLLLGAGLTLADVRDSYDAVIHLVTAAEGAEAFYSNANNAARRETAAEARALDACTLAAWVGHPHLRVIDNSTDFASKLERIVATVARVVGLPEPVEIERKFLLRSAPTAELLASLGSKPVEIEQTYLRSPAPGTEVRLRRRGIGANAVYYRTTKQARSATTRIETEQQIGRHQYELELLEADPQRHPIHKIRHCFVQHGTYFELDEFVSPHGLWLLEIELTDENDEIRLPAELDIAREVTGEAGWTNAELAAQR